MIYVVVLESGFIAFLERLEVISFDTGIVVHIITVLVLIASFVIMNGWLFWFIKNKTSFHLAK